MGVKGLQHFVEQCCPQACATVHLREMARQHVAKGQQDHTSRANPTSPTLVVDGLACLRHWYSCKDWICGGQWKEYMGVLESWVEAFTSAGIRLVFVFDGVVEEQKRRVWVKRRRRVNGEISKVFHHIKAHGTPPGRELFCLPSGLGTFTQFALRSLGQEVLCSVQEADYEIASYAHRHGSMGILGQDSDFIIYDSAPYLSVAKLRLDDLTTILYDRESICRSIGLAVAQLPLLACLLGNDVVPEEWMQHIRSNAMATYRGSCAPPGASQGEKVLAVAQLVSSVWGRQEGDAGLIPQSLVLSAPGREVLERGVRSYLLPGQEPLRGGDDPTFSPGSACVMERYVSPEILKACREKHVAAEGFMVYGVLCEGVLECSNTMEDEEETELLPQALVYKPCRQRIYGLLLLSGDGCGMEVPAVKEWFVYPGNPLKEPEMVKPAPLNRQGDQPSLQLLWFSSGPEVSDLRLASFLSVFDCQELSELYGSIEDSLLATLCLVTYIVLQVQQLSLEDMEAYLSQSVCLRLKSPQELQHIKLPYLSSRAVQLGSLYVRGLSHLLGANCASGCPLPSAALMPWNSFDGRLFHSKYLLAHAGAQHTLLLDGDSSCLSLFLCLRDKLLETCRRRGRTLQSRPRAAEHNTRPEHRDRNRPGFGSTHTGRPPCDGEMRRNQCGYQVREEFMERGGQGGGEMRGENQFSAPQQPHHPHSYPHYCDGRFQSVPPVRSRGRARRPNRQRFQLAPRWSQPPDP
ncbi:constitutive coactivator of peroxisome proliferator-activated receptor gamma isoform 1-T2 [Polymixia lowei]